MSWAQRDRERRMSALTALALAVKEKVEPATYVLYVGDTQRFPAQVLEIACERLRRSREWWPKLSDVIDECQLVARQQAERVDAQRRRSQLPESPIDAEKLARFKDDVARLVQRRRMR